MQNMTLSQALTLFGLKGKYTEEEIKNIYINLMKQYHPDRYERESQEIKDKMTQKSQEINEAYEVLKKNLTNPQQYTYANASTYWSSQSYQSYRNYSSNYDSTINIQKTNAIKTIRSYLKKCDAEKLRKQVSDLVMKYIIIISSNQDINITILNFKIDLEKLYRDYINIYAQKHNIPSFIIKQHKFNYDCDCAKLFSQLKTCERVIENDLSEIIRKHKLHEHFDILKDKIKDEENVIREKINFNITSEEYSQVLETYDNIIDKLITDYSIKYYEFKFALGKISRQLTEEIKRELYKNIKSIVLNADEDEMTELLISAIEESKPKKDSDIKEEVEQIEITENSENTKDSSKTGTKRLPKIREVVYKKLKEKYLNVSKTNIMEIELINNIFTTAVELLYGENCTIGTLGEIKKITFENPKEEYERLTKINTKNTIISDEFICINRAAYELYELDDCICKAKKVTLNETIHYAIKDLSCKEEFIDEKTFKENYLKIDDFLKDAIFLGYKAEKYPFDEVLYYDPKTELTLIRLINLDNEVEDTFVIGDTSPNRIVYKRNTKTDRYKNKAYLKEEISKYFDRRYEDNNKNNKNR